jgi:ABC-2 type transport system ATP-binding protein
MTAVLQAVRLGKQYGRRSALRDCTLAIPEGKIAGLVGPNGAGKTTLLQLAVGLLAPNSGTITVLGGRPSDGPAQLARVGFVAQDTPVYARLSVAKHLRMGAYLNPGWDSEFAASRIDQLGLDRRQRAGSLSAGQRAQLALTLATAKRPEILLLDEPVASLDPLARREFLQYLMETVASHQASVVLSSPTAACRLPETWTSCWHPTGACPGPAATCPPSRQARKSSGRVTPTSRASSWCAPTARSSTRPGPSSRSPWRTWCSPT